MSVSTNLSTNPWESGKEQLKKGNTSFLKVSSKIRVEK